MLELAKDRLLRYLDTETVSRFHRYDLLAYLPFLLLAAGVWGVKVLPTGAVLLTVIALHAPVLVVAICRRRVRAVQVSQGYLALLFFISGFAALIYQIVWQRTLFSAYGVNIESITIIVSLFTFGLGLGSLVGGLITKRFPDRAPELFLVCECGIGAFGVVSLPLIHYVSQLTLHASALVMSVVVFALLCLPTTLIGATLPILVGHVYRYCQNAGRSVGILYSINTLGSAMACFITADVLFVVSGQQGAVIAGAVCNLCVGLLVWQYARRLAQTGDALSTTTGGPTCSRLTEREADNGDRAFSEPLRRLQVAAPVLRGPSRSLKFLVLLFVAATGYISLSQEMLWMRIVSFKTGGRPTDFAHVLGCLLIGVALGSLYGKRLCERGFPDSSPAGALGGLLAGSAMSYYFSIAGIAAVRNLSLLVGLALTHMLVGLGSFLLGGVFTMLCHAVAHSGKSVGLMVSRVYVANIVGSVFGPLFTGFVLMDRFGIDRLVLGLSVATLLLGGCAFLVAGSGWRRLGTVPVIGGATALLLSHDVAYDRLFDRLQGGWQGVRFKYLVENRSGVISVLGDPRGDIIFGGGVYDGRSYIDPVVNANGILRCYMIAGLQPEPRDVLEIGLSGGAWARVKADYPPVAKLTVVEINPGYLELIRNYPLIAPILHNPKVEFHVDDGRRWLKRNARPRFDLIVANTSHFWRSYAVNVLSREFLTLCKEHVKPGGVMCYNTTGCIDVLYTATRVFRHVVACENFIAWSDSPFDLTPAEIRANVLKFSNERGRTFDQPDTRALLDPTSTQCLRNVGGQVQRQKGLFVVTDDNMAAEYKPGRRCLEWRMFGD